jgi:hypothetical protein
MADLLKRLQIKDHSSFLVVNRPPELKEVLSVLPGTPDTEPKGTYDFVMIFADSMEKAEAAVNKSIGSLGEDKLLWFCYPKKSSKKYSSDVYRDNSWELFDKYGFKGVRQISLDDDWSALRFRDKGFVKK